MCVPKDAELAERVRNGRDGMSKDRPDRGSDQGRDPRQLDDCVIGARETQRS
jgi:hypothetical protein